MAPTPRPEESARTSKLPPNESPIRQPVSYSVFEFGGRIFLIGTVEISFGLESNKWECTDYFLGGSVLAPMRTVAVDGLSDDIRIGIANWNGKVYAYKLLDGRRVGSQELPEVYTYLMNLFPGDMSVELSLSSLGNQEVLFISSSFHDIHCPEDPLVHYYCLRLRFTELPSGHSKPFVRVRVVDCCRKTVPMTDKDMRKVAFHIGMRSAFVL